MYISTIINPGPNIYRPRVREWVIIFGIHAREYTAKTSKRVVVNQPGDTDFIYHNNSVLSFHTCQTQSAPCELDERTSTKSRNVETIFDNETKAKLVVTSSTPKSFAIDNLLPKNR